MSIVADPQVLQDVHLWHSAALIYQQAYFLHELLWLLLSGQQKKLLGGYSMDGGMGSITVQVSESDDTHESGGGLPHGSHAHTGEGADHTSKVSSPPLSMRYSCYSSTARCYRLSKASCSSRCPRATWTHIQNYVNESCSRRCWRWRWSLATCMGWWRT